MSDPYLDIILPISVTTAEQERKQIGIAVVASEGGVRLVRLRLHDVAADRTLTAVMGPGSLRRLLDALLRAQVEIERPRLRWDEQDAPRGAWRRRRSP